MPSIQLGFNTSTFIIILLAAAASGVAILFYRHTLPPIPRSKRIALTTLRAVALTLLLVLLFEPLLRVVTTSQQPPTFAVLVDQSKSMAITDKQGDRAAQVKDIIAHQSLEHIVPEGNIRYYSFGVDVNQQEEFTADSLKLNEDGTDISSALRALVEDKARFNIDAAMLLSDGSYNLGQNPLHEAERLGMPLYTVGIGDSSEQKDLLITKIITNDVVYNQTEVPVDVTVKSSGYKDETVEATLAEGGRELKRERLTLAEGTQEYAVHLSYVPEGEGTKKFTVRVSSLPGELTDVNNRKSFFAKVLKSKLQIVILGGSPSPDLAIVRQTLLENKNFSVQSRTQREQSGFYEGTLTSAMVDSSDCIVLVGFPTSTTSGMTLDILRNALLTKNLPLLFINDPSVDRRKLLSIGSILPYTVGERSTGEQLAFMEPASSQRTNPILQVGPDGGLEGWAKLPPIFITQSVYEAKPEATVLGFTKINGVPLQDPLLLSRNINRQKSLAMLGYGIWRWRLMAQGSQETENLLATFLGNSIRWLTTRDDNRLVRVTPTKEAFTQGEPVEFVGQVYDASANPIENAQVRVTATSETKEYETLLQSFGNGRYEGSLEGLAEGDYTFKGVAEDEGQSIGADKGRFSVGELDLEFQDTRMNVSLLRQLAYRSGGTYRNPSEVGEIGNLLATQASFAPKEVQEAREIELWNWKYVLALVILLFVIEWFIRKRSGML